MTAIEPAPTRFSAFARALGHRNFRLYSIGNAVSMVGTWMQRVANGWLGWELTHSPTWLGVLAFADLFPTLIVSPLAGAVADRWDRMTMCQATQWAGFAQAALVAGFVLTGAMQIWILIALAVLGGVIAALNQPARLSLLNAVVEKSDLRAAVAINSIVFNAARFIGPAAAGLTILWFGIGWTFVLNALSFAVFSLALALIQVPRETRVISTSLMRDVAEGFAYAGRHPVIGRLFLLLVATGIGVRPIVELLPGIADQTFGAGVSGLATLSSAMAVGSIAGSFWIATKSRPPQIARYVVLSAIAASVFVLLFSLAPSYWLGVGLIAVIGFFLIASGAGTQTVLQLLVDGDYRGRVLSLHSMIFRGGPALGALAMGVVADFAGFRVALAIGCVLTGILGIVMLRPGRMGEEPPA